MLLLLGCHKQPTVRIKNYITWQMKCILVYLLEAGNMPHLSRYECMVTFTYVLLKALHILGHHGKKEVLVI